MALPAGVTTCTVTAGSALDFAGDPHTITVTWKPILGGPANAAAAIVWAATGQPLINFSETVTSESGSQVSFQVPHVDQEGFVNAAGDAVTMWSYQATISVRDSRGEQYQKVKNFQVLQGQTVIDLDLVPDGSITSPTSAPLPAVLSVNGETGNVEVPLITDVAEGALDTANAALLADPESATAVEVSAKSVETVLPGGAAYPLLLGTFATVEHRTDTPLRYLTEAPELVTDWQPAITAALGDGGKTVELPALTMNLLTRYTTTNKNLLGIPSNTTIVGRAGSVLRAADTLESDRVILYGAGVENVEVRGLEIDGNKGRFADQGGTIVANVGHEDELINFKGGCKNLHFADLYLHDAGADAFDFDPEALGASITDSRDLWITNVLVEDCGGNVVHNGLPNMYIRGLTARRNTFRRGQGGITNPWTINLNYSNQFIDGLLLEDNWGGVKFNKNADGRRGLYHATILRPESEEGVACTGGAINVDIDDVLVVMKAGSTKDGLSAALSRIRRSRVQQNGTGRAITNSGGEVSNCETTGGSIGIYSASSGTSTHIVHRNNIARGATTYGHRIGGSALLTAAVGGNEAFDCPAFDFQPTATQVKMLITDNDPHGGNVNLAAPGPHTLKGNAGSFASGTTSKRLAAARVAPGSDPYFDTTLGKPVWSNGTAWVDATGATV